MDVAALISTALAWLVVVVVPGPNFLTTVQVAATRSRGAGLAVVGGIGVGTTAWATAAAVGLAVVFQTVGWLYQVLRAAGAAYLLLLGIAMIWHALRTGRAPEGQRPTRRTGATPRVAFFRGLLTDPSNPKAAVFFTSLFAVAVAVAVPPGAAPAELAAFVALMPAIAMAWYATVALALSAGPVARAFQRVRRHVQVVAGGILAAFGVRLAAEH
ncbi:MAG: lysine transporter LysE [Streptosporangiales bacterium]|nr:lysine transporter LysE [Streptosporangiales bacterium]